MLFNAIFALKFRPILTKDFICLNSDNLRKQNPSFEGLKHSRKNTRKRVFDHWSRVVLQTTQCFFHIFSFHTSTFRSSVYHYKCSRTNYFTAPIHVNIAIIGKNARNRTTQLIKLFGFSRNFFSVIDRLLAPLTDSILSR